MPLGSPPPHTNGTSLLSQPNVPPPDKRMKSFLGIGNTCVVTAYEKSLGISNGYSRGRYMLHTYGCWPDDDLMIEMNKRHQEVKEKKKAKKAATPDVEIAD